MEEGGVRVLKSKEKMEEGGVEIEKKEKRKDIRRFYCELWNLQV